MCNVQSQRRRIKRIKTETKNTLLPTKKKNIGYIQGKQEIDRKLKKIEKDGRNKNTKILPENK